MDSDERKEKYKHRWKTCKATLGWLTVYVENALERKWNFVSSRWKCVNFPSTLELESPWMVVLQKQKNRKKKSVNISTGRSERKGSHFYERLRLKGKVAPQSRSHPFFLFSFMLWPQHLLSHLFFLLPSCPFISSLFFLSLLLLPSALTSLPAPFFPFLNHSPSSSDAELGLKKSDLIELLAVWEHLFVYYLIQL